MKRLVTAGVLSISLLGAAGWSSPVFAAPEPAPSQEKSTNVSATTSTAKGFGPQSNLRLATKNSDFGPMLFNRNRQAIYLFDKEQSKRSECYGSCAMAWPPVLTRGAPEAVGRTRQGLIGITKRRGGAKQVTYRGHPLYYYVNEGPGQVFCHNVFQYGGTWLVVKPNGKPAD